MYLKFEFTIEENVWFSEEKTTRPISRTRRFHSGIAVRVNSNNNPNIIFERLTVTIKPSFIGIEK